MPIRPENRDRYGADWPQFSRFIRFERAAGRCECEGECGRGTHRGRCPNVHGGPAYGTGARVCLTVAHLTHQPEDREHVKAMCNGCHLHYDRAHHAQTAYATRKAAARTLDLFFSSTKEATDMTDNDKAPGADALGKVLHDSLAQTLGEYPDGRLNAADQGAISLAIGVEGGAVVLRFPTPVTWIGFPPAQAMEMAVALMKHARRAGLKEPLVWRAGGPRPLDRDVP